MSSTPRNTAAKLLTVAQISERLSVSGDVVLDWIHAKKLPAIDVSVHQNKKARWRIRPDDLDAFLILRERRENPPPRPRRKKKTGLVEFVK